jgi:hypothetical protein
MKHLNHLYNSLLNEDELDISLLDVVKIAGDDDFVISILMEFQLNNLEISDKIVQQLDAFTEYLDSILRE